MEWETPRGDDDDQNWVPWVVAGFIAIMVLAGLIESCKG